MYESFYNLKERAFNLTPDPQFLYFTEKHCEALANLAYGIRERKGFLVLSGEAGTGKTTLVNALLDTLGRTNAPSAFIFNPILTVPEFFECLLNDFSLKADGSSKTQMLMRLNSFLLERYKIGQVAVLVVDEAHDLSSELLEEIRLLTNLETTKQKLLQIVLVGQPELILKLNSPNLRQLKQRISLRCKLEPLTLFETKEYINTRLEIAGLPTQEIFPDGTIAEIFRRSGGIPRLINTICDNTMLSGYASDAKTITIDIVKEVCKDLEFPNEHRPFERKVDLASPSGAAEPNLADQPESEVNGTSRMPGHIEAESLDLFVQFVDRLRDLRTQRERS